MLLFPKPKRKTKVPKWLKRSPIKKAKGSFKASDSPKRRPRRNQAKTDAWALQKQREKLTQLSPFQLAVGQFLRDHGVRYEYETYWRNGSYPIFSDIYIPGHKLTLEIDGHHHTLQVRADTDRALFLARTYGVATARFTNAEVKSGKYKARLLPMLGLGTPPCP